MPKPFAANERRNRRATLWLIFAIIALCLSALYVIGLAVDRPDWVHGSNWVWARRVPPPTGRLWLLAAVAGAGLALAWAAARPGRWSRGATALFLGGLVVFTPLVQLAVAAQHRGRPLSVAFLTAGGFFHEGARIEAPVAFVQNHTARMPSYRDAHLRTQPPGWPVAFWAARRVWERFPAAADWTGRQLLRYDCLSTDLQGMAPPQLAAATLQMLILLLSGLGVLPLYALGRALSGAAVARTAAVAYPFLPAFLVFQSRFDVLYALVAVAVLWFGYLAAARGRVWAGVVAALLLAVGTFFGFGLLGVVVLLNLFLLGLIAAGAAPRRDGLRRLLLLDGLFVAGVALLWGGLWLAWGVSGPEMFRLGQDIHRELRLNYPVWPLFNLYDLAVFMGIVPFVGAALAVVVSLFRLRRPRPGDALILGWAAALLALQLSATVRAETGRLWLFMMVPGLLVGAIGWIGEKEQAQDEGTGEGGKRRQDLRRPGLWLALLMSAYVVQALATGYFLGGRVPPATVADPVWRLPESARPLDYQLGEAIALRGYEAAQDGEALRVTLYWQATGFPRADYSVFLHQLGEGPEPAAQVVAQADGPPQAGSLPTWCWVPGEIVADERIIRPLPTGGPIRLGVGLYDWQTGARLPVQPAVADDAILLPPVGEP